MQYHSRVGYYSANVGGPVVLLCIQPTPGNSFVCNGPEFSTDIATLPHIVACVWHLRLQLGKLAPLDIIHKARNTATYVWLIMRTVHARCFMQRCRAHWIINALVLWSWQRPFLRLCIHCITYYNSSLHTYIKLCTYMHQQFNVLHPLCLRSGYGFDFQVLSWRLCRSSCPFRGEINIIN